MARYRVQKLKIKDSDVWRVEESRRGRIVSVYLSEGAAASMTHTLNVADLGTSIVAFDAERQALHICGNFDCLATASVTDREGVDVADYWLVEATLASSVKISDVCR